MNRYQPGGDIYATLSGQYGTPGADTIAAAARTGDNNGEVAAAIAQVKYGAPLSTSVMGILANQLATDPLAAPLADANTLAKNSIASMFKNYWFTVPLVIAIAVGLFIWMGGMTMLKGKLK
jgi:hypothetical protein